MDTSFRNNGRIVKDIIEYLQKCTKSAMRRRARWPEKNCQIVPFSPQQLDDPYCAPKIIDAPYWVFGKECLKHRRFVFTGEIICGDVRPGGFVDFMGVFSLKDLSTDIVANIVSFLDINIFGEEDILYKLYPVGFQEKNSTNITEEEAIMKFKTSVDRIMYTWNKYTRFETKEYDKYIHHRYKIISHKVNGYNHSIDGLHSLSSFPHNNYFLSMRTPDGYNKALYHSFGALSNIEDKSAVSMLWNGMNIYIWINNGIVNRLEEDKPAVKLHNRNGESISIWYLLGRGLVGRLNGLPPVEIDNKGTITQVWCDSNGNLLNLGNRPNSIIVHSNCVLEAKSWGVTESFWHASKEIRWNTRNGFKMREVWRNPKGKIRKVRKYKSWWKSSETFYNSKIDKKRAAAMRTFDNLGNIIYSSGPIDRCDKTAVQDEVPMDDTFS